MFTTIVASNCLQLNQNGVYYYCKVDVVREVLRLGKSVNERAHLFCGAMFGPLQKRFDWLHLPNNPVC